MCSVDMPKTKSVHVSKIILNLHQINMSLITFKYFDSLD